MMDARSLINIWVSNGGGLLKDSGKLPLRQTVDSIPTDARHGRCQTSSIYFDKCWRGFRLKTAAKQEDF
ncbi:Hypothetical predicted protein [Scomber scombrus]|uniref:Uncharacterized protein n=1 Tax=Scomber scombrus TaxID=13677 RepID=A0AAV1PH09_SCOSC